MTQLDDYLVAQRLRFEDDLCELLKIPSVSADPAYRGDVRRAGQWVADQFHGLGFATEIVETAGHPIVFAQGPAVPDTPTVLVYGHYDVQPPDPLSEWHSPPFEPTRRDGNLYARGATDDKGQMLTHLKSAQAWLATERRLPINLKYLIEGEEEVGSANLEHFIEQYRDRLACDCVVISDTSQFAPGIPAITYGLRGLAYFELRIAGPKQDLHSGTFGGSVMNPAIALARLLAAMIGSDGRIQLSGFYDDVVPLTEAERKKFAALPFDEADYKRQLGVSAVVGEAGYSTLERRWVRPTFDIHGLTSGYQGEGAKTVLPARASAKFSFRLVPNQDPAKVAAAVRAFVKEQCPPGVTCELVEHHGAPGIVVPLDSPHVAAASRAIERSFGRAPVFMREGGSIPVVATFKKLLGVDALLLGWGRDDDNTHSPNEKFNLDDYHRGIRASAYLWHELTNLTKN